MRAVPRTSQLVVVGALGYHRKWHGCVLERAVVGADVGRRRLWWPHQELPACGHNPIAHALCHNHPVCVVNAGCELLITSLQTAPELLHRRGRLQLRRDEGVLRLVRRDFVHDGLLPVGSTVFRELWTREGARLETASAQTSVLLARPKERGESWVDLRVQAASSTCVWVAEAAASTTIMNVLVLGHPPRRANTRGQLGCNNWASNGRPLW
mmetsp:Transcript_48642/g.135940  ORF Transcript_48642/g.135940 Transcript_48642/m.135940 type:complete len:211 (+) Transcript_48642:567-1199(+)